MNANLEWKLHNLPDSPGCYLMKHEGEIIYVGKAKNLKNRVIVSISTPPKTTRRRCCAMVEKIDDFDIVLVDGELEAFTLECNLIKTLSPALQHQAQGRQAISLYPRGSERALSMSGAGAAAGAATARAISAPIRARRWCARCWMWCAACSPCAMCSYAIRSG